MTQGIWLLAFFWLFQLIFQSWNLVFWWQIKEYRWDRFLVHLKTRQGQKLIWGLAVKLKLMLLAAAAWSPVELTGGQFEIGVRLWLALALGLYTALNLKAVLNFRQRGPRPARLTLKTGGLFLALLAFAGLILAWSVWQPNQKFLITALVLGDLLLLPMSFPLIGILNLATGVWQRQIIRRAQIRLEAQPGLVRIGLTGSYGKTSTKYFLKQILSAKYEVVASAGSVNTLIGLAQTVIDQVKPATQILIAEMGAYHQGEIKRICQLIKPKIGILLAINRQHQSLFGSMAAVKKAKYELIEALPDDGLAVFNADNEPVFRLGQKTAKPKVFYSLDQSADFGVESIQVNPFSVKLTLKLPRGKLRGEVPVLGRHNVANLLPALAVAVHLGFDAADLSGVLGKLDQPEKTLKPAGRFGRAWLFDDTWNANPDGVLAALDYLDLAWPKSRKIIVLQPLIELGRFAGQEHERLGRRLARTGDLIFLTNDNYYPDLKKGAGDQAGRLQVQADQSELVSWFKTNLKTDDVVVFQGKEAGHILEKLKLIKDKFQNESVYPPLRKTIAFALGRHKVG